MNSSIGKILILLGVVLIGLGVLFFPASADDE